MCAAVVVSACSNPGARERASGDYEYMKTEQTSSVLNVPDDLESPRRSNQYELPILKTSDTSPILGSSLRISSPRLVLALVAGSYVEEGSNSATVIFDQVNEDNTLDKTVWDKVLAYLEQNSIGVESFDRENNILVTDWVVSQTELDTSWYDFSSSYIDHAKRFKLSLDLAPHGRTASLTSEIVDYIDDDGDSSIASMDVITRRINEVDFLNFIIEEYDFSIRLAQNQRIEKIRDGFNSELGFDPDGDSAMVIDAAYNDTWPRLLLVLRKMGFDVIDLDQSSGIMFVIYNGQEDGFWAGMFSDDELELDEGNYRIFVRRSGAKTTITFKDSESISFSAQQTSDIFPVFKEYMASDNLDI